MVLRGLTTLLSRYSKLGHLAVLGAVAVLYFLIDREYGGPAYLADEIGYLSNAAFLAGYGSDGASSYHGGYSLLLAPVFRLLGTASSIWTGVLVLNCLMWGATAVLVKILLDRLSPRAAPWLRWLAFAVVVAYPASATMSGYAFSQSTFALVFIAATASLLWVDPRRPITIVPHAVLAGYLYWIHPAGLAVATASIIAVLIAVWRSPKKIAALVNVAVVIAMILLYEKGMKPWMIEGMTPAGSVPSLHYPGLRNMMAGLSLDRMHTMLGVFFGQIGYLVLGTFGFIVLGAIAAAGNVMPGIRAKAQSGDAQVPFWRVAVSALLLLSIPGIIAESVFAVLASYPSRIDHWLYGRYVEPVILPLLALGLTVRSRWQIALACAIFLLAVGAWLGLGLKISGPVNLVNVPALWPRLLDPASSVFLWFCIAAALVPLALCINRVAASTVLIAVFAWCVLVQQRWHLQILEGHSNPSAIPEFVRTNYPNAKCVGFDSGFPPKPGSSLLARERGSLYSYYLFMYPLRKMPASQWAAGCDGPLLTFDPQLSKTLGAVKYVGREAGTNLYIVVKDRDPAPVFPVRAESGRREEYWASKEGASCVFADCFSIAGEQFSSYSRVGKVNRSGISTDGRQGYLFFGPYAALDAGTYVVDMSGQFAGVQGATLDVVSDHGGLQHFRAPLSGLLAESSDRIRVFFTLDKPAVGLEVRLAVTSNDRLLVSSYEVALASESEAAPVSAAPRLSDPLRISFGPIELAASPRQVGSSDGRGLHADGRQGFLMYGPYRPMPSGRYRLSATGSSGSAVDAWLDIASSKGAVQHARVRIPSARSNATLLEQVVVLDKDVKDLEIRVFVGQNDRLTIEQLSFVPISKPQ